MNEHPVPVAGLLLIVLIFGLSALVLVAQGVAGHGDRPTAFITPAATVAAQTVAVPVPPVAVGR